MAHHLTSTHQRFDGEAADTAIVVTHHEHGRRLEGFTHYQVSASGLDGGTATVEARLPGDETWKALAGGAIAETSVAAVSTLLLQALRVTFAGLGAGADPVVTLTSWVRP